MKSTKKKSTVKISFWKDILPVGLTIGVIVVIMSYIEMACLDTLLPICIRWMYYPFVMCVIFIALETFREHFGKPKKKKQKGPSLSFSFTLKCMSVLILIPAFIFIPNRYIPTKPKTEYLGVVIDNTTWPAMTKTPINNNYVKVKLNGENTSFWYCLKKDSKSLGSKCFVSVKRGIFGMRYVKRVNFQD